MSITSEPVRNLGAMFDSQLIMAPHVKSVVKKSSFHLRNIGKARCVLTEDATKTVMQSLVMSRLDYCNALLIGIQQDLIAKLQRLKNSAARIVSRTRKYEHITPVLIKLHWLPIKFRIQFKLLLLAGLGSITLESNQLYYITLENSPIILYYNYSNFFKVINYIILLSKM